MWKPDTSTSKLDGEWNSGQDCDGPHGGGGGFTPVEGDGPHELDLDGTGRYLIWAAWAADQPKPEPSAAQQAEMADGVVTYEEYHAAFDRFSQCMSDAGYPLMGAGPLGDLMNYATSNEAYLAGVDQQCYIAEFMTVDSTWQVAHEDTSETAQFLRDCLAEHGIEPPQTMEEIHAALDDAGISFEDCGPRIAACPRPPSPAASMTSCAPPVPRRSCWRPRHPGPRMPGSRRSRPPSRTGPTASCRRTSSIWRTAARTG